MTPDPILTIHDARKIPVRILFLMATNAEHGVELESLGIRPAIIGVGPIEAAINTTALLKDMEREGLLPDLIINMGSAGSRQLNYETIAQATSISYRDMDASPFGFEKGKTPFSSLPAQLPIQARIPGLAETTVSTGGNVISGQAYETFTEQTAEMEAYALYSASLKFGIPMLRTPIVAVRRKREPVNVTQSKKAPLASCDHRCLLTIRTLKALAAKFC